MAYESLREGGFVGGYVTDTFKNYVLSVIDKAKSLQKEGSLEYKILDAIERAHTEVFPQFEFALDALCKDDTKSWMIGNALFPFESDIDSPQNKLEGKMIAYLLEYKVLTSFEENDPIEILPSLHKLLNFADKYFDKEDYSNSVPYSPLVEKLVAKEPDSIAPFFMECFLPQVKIEGSKVYISYILPLSMQNALKNPDNMEMRNDNIESYFEKSVPYSYTVSVNFSLQNGLNNFDSIKKQVINFIRERSITGEENIPFKLVNVYLEDILNNLTVEDGHIVPIKTSFDCTQKIEDALKTSEDEAKTLKVYKSRFSQTNFESMFVEPALTVLNHNRDLLENALENPKIEFKPISSTSNETVQHENYAVVILSIAVLLLFALLIVAILRINKMKKLS
jgi:hypothetical protein